MTRRNTPESSHLSPRLRAWLEAGHYLQHGRHRLFYRAAGHGAPLLLLHAYPSAGWGWHRMWDALARERLVIAPDLFGSGFSAKPVPGPYSIAELADQCEAVLAELGVSEVDVLAHAYGVSPAQELLARSVAPGACPTARVRSVAFLNGAIFPAEAETTAMQRLLIGPLGPMIARLAPQPYTLFRRNLAHAFGPDTPADEATLADLWQLLRFNEGHRATPWVMQYLRDRLACADRLVTAITQTRIPRLLIHAPGDPIVGERMREQWQARIPEADIADLGRRLGHYPPLEAPQAVLEAFNGFQRRLKADRHTGN